MSKILLCLIIFFLVSVVILEYKVKGYYGYTLPMAALEPTYQRGKVRPDFSDEPPITASEELLPPRGLTGSNMTQGDPTNIVARPEES